MITYKYNALLYNCLFAQSFVTVFLKLVSFSNYLFPLSCFRKHFYINCINPISINIRVCKEKIISVKNTCLFVPWHTLNSFS